MVAVFNPNMVRYHQSMIHQHLEAHSPLTEGHHPPLAGGPPLPTHRGYSPSAEGVASVHGVQTSISPQVLTKDSRPPPLSHQCTAELSSLDKLIPAVTAMVLIALVLVPWCLCTCAGSTGANPTFAASTGADPTDAAKKCP